MRYYGIEPMLIDLKSRGERIAHIYIKDHKASMTLWVMGSLRHTTCATWERLPSV